MLDEKPLGGIRSIERTMKLSSQRARTLEISAKQYRTTILHAVPRICEAEMQNTGLPFLVDSNQPDLAMSSCFGVFTSMKKHVKSGESA